MAAGAEARAAAPEIRAWRAILAGLAASLVGIGLARFAYTPLIPAVIEAGWFAPASAAYLGAANLMGYLVGALLGRRLGQLYPARAAIRAMMLVAAVGFIACAGPAPFAWFFVWRLLSGIAGGVLMVLAAPTVLRLVPPGRRGLAGGLIFTGVGLGIAASGTLVPLLLGRGLGWAWAGLGLLGLAITALAWPNWPGGPPPGPAPAAPPGPGPERHPGLLALYGAYALNAFGLVPHMIFIVDFIARGLGRGLEVGAAYWIAFGIGAMLGPVSGGLVADRIGFGRTLRLAFLVQAAAIGLPLLATDAVALLVSCVLVGAFVPGVVPLVLGRVHELIPDGQPAARARAWTYVTTAFAVGQAAGAYGLSYLFGRSGSYDLLFALGVLALLLAFTIESAARILSARRAS